MCIYIYIHINIMSYYHSGIVYTYTLDHTMLYYTVLYYTDS